ncbi:MAG: RNA methyltransferase [Rhizobiaceae bacterium]|nr:RNA methyltransferase [Rhizobiaceae bacterium]
MSATDVADPRLAPYTGLREREVLKSGRFVCEGKFILERLLRQKRFRPVSALITPDRLEPLRPILAIARPDFEVYVADQTIMNAIAGHDVHRGVLACAETGDLALGSADLCGFLDNTNHIAIVSGVANGENLGAIIRNAAGLGMDGLIVDARSIHPLSRRAIRVSMGTVFTLPWLRVEDPGVALAETKRAGFALYGLTPSGGTVIDAVRFADKSAVLFGEEAHGLSAGALDATLPLAIPMARDVDSLNVAATSAIVFHAMRAQRADH